MGFKNALGYWKKDLQMYKPIFMDMSVSFLLQATRVLHVGNYDDDEVQMIYDFIKSLDNEIIFHYFSTKTVLSYKNDLELLLEIIDKMIAILERVEEYEKCLILKNKKEQCLQININKIIENE
jgi:hypothetical protein